jgi:anionic cell wall polymer biosynthesis LytR-Cps2A-Psr (LCP) family protein
MDQLSESLLTALLSELVREVDMVSDLGRRRLGWLAAGVALLVILSGFGLLVYRVQHPPDPAPASAVKPSGGLVLVETGPPSTTAPTTPPAGADLAGPLNILLVGVDTRVSVPGWQPHSDAVLLLHLPAGLDKGYLFSLPRDLIVDIPADRAAGFGGGRMKLTESMAYGSRVPGHRRVDVKQGLDLLTRTVSNYTGIEKFDASAVLTFSGLSRLADALGGVTLRIDQKVVSKHIRPDGKHRAAQPGGGGYVGPQMVYRPGVRKLVGWQAIDYARQRYTAGGDYTRQRHQQQLIKAMLTQAADAGLATDQDKLKRVLTALGDTLIFDGRGTDPIAFAYALRALRPENLTLIGLPGSGVGTGTNYRGEQLRKTGRDFLAALVAGNQDAFLSEHPKIINKS